MQLSFKTPIWFYPHPVDFRKQIDGLVALVTMQFKLDPFSESCAFIFCNKRKNAIKVLRYDKNGFVLASKKLLEDLKFQWPRTPDEVKEVKSEKVAPKEDKPEEIDPKAENKSEEDDSKEDKED